MTISLHVVVDNCPDEELERALLYLKRVRPGTVDIAAGAQVDRGMQFVERVRADVAGITVFWRNLDPEDTGIHSKMSAAEVYKRKVWPHLDWFRKHQVVFMPDNESSGDDEQIRRYAAWQAEMARWLHADGLRGAFCRFATGNIVESQYVLLKPIFDVMLPGDYVSPNEYSAQPGYPPGSGGHLERYKLLWQAAGRELPTVIGEAGIAMNYDPGKGYLDAGMTDKAYAQQLLDEDIWYQAGAIDRHVYLVGGFSHAGYKLRAGVLKYWEDHYATPPPVVVQQPVETPASPPSTPPPAPPQSIEEGSEETPPAWMDGLDERQRQEIAFARVYAKDFGHGTDGHHRLLLIAKLAALLDSSDKAAYRKLDKGGFSVERRLIPFPT